MISKTKSIDLALNIETIKQDITAFKNITCYYSIRLLNKKEMISIQFKNITCYYSIVATTLTILTPSRFKNITCYYSIKLNNLLFVIIAKFKNITCYYSILQYIKRTTIEMFL